MVTWLLTGDCLIQRSHLLISSMVTQKKENDINATEDNTIQNELNVQMSRKYCMSC